MKRIWCLILSLATVLTVFGGTGIKVGAADGNVITEENPAVVIRTSFATCGYADNWGGVHTAAPIKDKEGYVLYDVIIWEDRINLYKFPDNVEHNEKEGFDFSVDVTTEKGLKKYVEWRESFCLKSVKCENTNDISKCSSTMKKAYIAFFETVNKRSPSKNIVLKYSGHGNIGFCGCMNIEDTKATLEEGVAIFGQKFALIDFGTNCRSSNTDYLQVYHNFTDYMLGAQFDYGGFTMDEWDYEVYKKYNVDYQYDNMFKIGQTIEQAGKNIVNITTKYWEYCKKSLKDGSSKQSMTLFDMSEYDAFMNEFSALLYKTGDSYTDAYTVINEKGSKKLKKLYKKFVVHYKDNNNEEYFIWDEKAYGLTAKVLVCQVKLSQDSYTYDGKSHKPTVNIVLTNGMTLSEGTDYTLTYSKGRKKPGKYKVTVSYKYNYGSKQELYFTIEPREVSVSSIKAVKKGFKLKWEKSSEAVTGYQIQYSLKSSFASSKTVLVKKSDTVSKTVKGLKSKKKYYVRIRAYKTVGGEKVYGNYSKVKTVKTK